jgi:hypothetical protein
MVPPISRRYLRASPFSKLRSTMAFTGSPRRLQLVKPSDRDYDEVLRTRLKWNEAGAPPGKA